MDFLRTTVLLSFVVVFTIAEGDPTCTIEVSSDMKCTRFTTTFESFFPLVDREYRYRAIHQNGFKENISLSMYRYYMAQHLYARLIQLRSSRGLASSTEERFQKHLHSIAGIIPQAEAQYLDGIGDIEVYHDGVLHVFQYSFLTWPNKHGHFGRVDAGSHWKYMSFPAPSVVAQAIREDYLKSLDPARNPNWDLKPHLFPPPDDFYPGSPTANLLGWKPATPMTLQQIEAIISCGINDVDFDETNSQFLFNPRLVMIVRDYLEGGVQFKDFTYRQAQSVINQLGWLERNQRGDTSLSRSLASVERDVIGKLHPLQSHYNNSSTTSLIMGYRVKKLKGTINDWAVYDWQNYESVPDDWVKTRNTVFDFGRISEDNSTDIEFSDERDYFRTELIKSSFKFSN